MVQSSGPATAAAIDAPSGTLELDTGLSSLLTLGTSAGNSSIGNLDAFGGNVNGPATIDVGGNIDWTAGQISWSNPISIVQTGNGSFQISCPSNTQPILNGSSITTSDPIDMECPNFATVQTNPVSMTTTSTLDLAASMPIGSGHGTITAAGVKLEPSSSTVYAMGSNALVLTGGTTVVPSGDTLHEAFGTTVNGGTLVDDGTVSPSQVTLNGGMLEGTGYLVSVANNSGDILPGDSPSLGTLQVGSITLGAGSTLTIPIAGAGLSSSLAVEGGFADLGGTLALQPAAAYAASPSNGDQFTVLGNAVGSTSGAFANVTTSPALGDGATFNLSYGNDNAIATVDAPVHTGPTAPQNTVPPVISGQTVAGQILTTTDGSWTQNPTSITYQWEDCPAGSTAITSACTVIPGATASSYTLANGDVGKDVSVVVTAANAAGSAAADAVPVGPITAASGMTTTTSTTTTTPTATTTTATTTTPTTTTATTAGPASASPQPPASLTPPTVTGTPAPGDALTCTTGTWTHAPTAYAYQWLRNGTAIQGATSSSYAVQILDEATDLACDVTARNGDGSSVPVESAPILVAVPGTLTCPRPSGAFQPTRIGPLALGEGQAAARRALTRYHVTHYGFDDFCLYAGWGIRGAYRGQKVVLLLTANPFYSVDGITPGMSITAAAQHLRIGRGTVVGLNDWYFAAGARSTVVFKVRDGIIQEIGIADSSDTRLARQRRSFIAGFRAA
jgi:hypothetical protein